MKTYADNSNSHVASAGTGQVSGPKGAVHGQFESKPETSTANPDTDPAASKKAYHEDMPSRPSANGNCIH